MPLTSTSTIRRKISAQEYFPGINPERFARHESFFCTEVASWAERLWNVSHDPQDRFLFGTSNGGRFVFEMALRHPRQFGTVLAFSVPGGGPIKIPDRYETTTRFFLEAGTWEQNFLTYTSRLAETLKQAGVRVEFRSRVGGHDEAIWREEFASPCSRCCEAGDPRQATRETPARSLCTTRSFPAERRMATRYDRL